MNLIEIFKKELEQEAQTTRKMLAIIPNDSYDWRPHPKSMTITRLATHVAEIPGWIALTLTTSELDFATESEHTFYSNTQDVLDYFEKNVADAKAQLDAATEADLQKPWTMRNGEQIYFTNTKAEVIRMSFSQLIHHRAQLGVFLRLLNVPIPGSYGPSADEMEMVFA
ncbi:DinB family protein [Mucilaginibacter boryungensis]|uniref:DinB family protein n=1 Tax=Mucilaginibacter boryungensis TaxID=768480 RepID=A0ABR9XDP7_9SPHI|nr:DinB family protein [Mucilaginibacter boryungensis]MBE9665302.1 DinB family protein [Mucilaginibacter boryungensis]